MREKLKYNPDRCKQCGLCVANCPKQAISFREEVNLHGYRTVIVDHDKCIGCGICYTMCPDGVYEILERNK